MQKKNQTDKPSFAKATAGKQTNNPFPKMEQEVLAFWDRAKIFEKSVKRNAPRGDYVFYDGPPFATGMPHYGHIVASVMKDAVPRYWTMKGYRVERRWGWDCHGLPIENIVEKELGSKNKKDIEKIGVEKFNKMCESKVLGYVDEWKKIMQRLGRWADMENCYKTMDLKFMESVWWVFKELWDKGLIYEGYKSMHICPRCETTLSQSEVAEGYKDVKDLSAIVKFRIKNKELRIKNVDIKGDVYILAWTTTPWTLLGNVALAIGENIKYVLVEIKNQKLRIKEYYILAKDRIEEVLKDKEYKIVKKFKGKDLIGLEYKPLFGYYANDKKLKNKKNGWKIYEASFVNTEEGTGVVHIAPAFGEDDMKLRKKENLPFIQHVGMDGVIKKEAEEFAGMNVKPAGNHMQTDIEIIKYLARENLLFAKEKYEHSYPHCWRCDTPLINYATSSWFVNILKIKKRILELAKDINWSPEHIKKGRWGNWLEGARDWSISRQRFWASVIPIWKCEKCNEIKVIGSIEDIKKQKFSTNRYFILRHGLAEQNVKGIINSSPERKFSLTKIGKIQVKKSALKLKKILSGENLDIIFSSDLRRCEQTAKIVSGELGAEINFSPKLRDLDFGEYDGKNIIKYKKDFPYSVLRFKERLPKGESWNDCKKRMIKFIGGIEKKYQNKNILIVSHGDPLWLLEGAMKCLADNEILKVRKKMIKKAELKEIEYKKFPWGENGELDFHRPYIDDVKFSCFKCGGEMKRVPDVFDCWFESGAMPYAQCHYPFENKDKFEKNFPAEFIAEGVDQTRCWFYYLHAIAVGIKDSAAYNNVIVNGIVLAEDGKKMSKKLQNYPDPSFIFEQYSADALRYYLLSSPVLLAENLNFSKDGVKESLRKVEMILWNVYKFYEMYVESQKPKAKSDNVLDKWIVARLNQLIKEVTENMDKYNLPKAARPIEEFINDLSTWYLRRSRNRFKGDDEKDKKAALQTTGFVLLELTKIMAPFMPFIAEQIWQRVSGNDFKDKDKSVHLESWPKPQKKLRDKKLEEKMEKVREIVAMGLTKRKEAGIKVRQPLTSLKFQISNFKFQNELLGLIKDELNVKEVKIKDKKGGLKVELDTEITPRLKEEGIIREIVRAVQGMRKFGGLKKENKIKIFFDFPDDLTETVKQNKEQIKKETIAPQITEGKEESCAIEKEFNLDNQKVWLGIKKI